MPTMYITCPFSGLSYTVTDDYQVSRFASYPHPSYSDLPNIISKDKWKAPASYIVAGLFHYLTTNNLITNLDQEPPTARGQINHLLSSSFTPSKLYSLYSRLSNSKAPMALNPIRVNLATLSTLPASEIYSKLLLIATQSLSEADKNDIWDTTITKRSRKKVKLTKRSPKRAPINIYSRLSKEVPKLYKMLMDSELDLPTYLSSSIVTQVSRAIPMYSQLTPRKQEDICTVLKDIFNVAVQNSFVSQHDELGHSYYWFIDKANKGLINTQSAFFTALNK